MLRADFRGSDGASAAYVFMPVVNNGEVVQFTLTRRHAGSDRHDCQAAGTSLDYDESKSVLLLLKRWKQREADCLNASVIAV